MSNQCQLKVLKNHPCFNVEASAHWGRVHLPVAPNCNIQCKFCNRKYDCINENRPGVTEHVYDTTEAVSFLDSLLQKRSDISVAGIAGPGDPLCEPERTLETLQAVHDHFPELILCVSSNGLNVPGHVKELAEVGVTHMTITVNAVDPKIAQNLYSFVKLDNHVYHGLDAAKLLLSRQAEAIQGLKAQGIIVKVNTVVVPGVNMDHVAAIAEKAKTWNVDIMNCMTMIPVEGTPFENVTPPTATEIACIRKTAKQYVPQMYHCCRCRADAVGLLCHRESGQWSVAGG